MRPCLILKIIHVPKSKPTKDTLYWLAEFNQNESVDSSHQVSSMDVSVSEVRNSYYEPGPSVQLCQTVSDYKNFASHPLEVDYRIWQTTTTYGNVTTDIFALFLTTASGTPLGNKLANLRFYTGNIKITVVVQGSPYAQGKLVYSFDPYNLNITGAATTRIQAPQKCRAMYLPNIVIDPSKNASYELLLPPCNHWGLYNILGTNYGSWSWNYIAFNPLGSGTTTEPNIGVTTYFSLEDSGLNTLTFSSVQMKEEKKFSSFFARASTISNYASSVAPPAISAGLTLFSVVTGGLSKFLSFFGYGKHVIQEVAYIRGFNTANNLTCVDGKMDASILSTRMTNGISISPNDCPLLSQEDQMISKLCEKEGLVHQHYLATSSPGTGLLFSLPVSPFIVFPLASPAFTGKYELTTLAFCASMFRYWRADIDVTLEAVCSVFHRATIMLAYFPNRADVAVAYSNAVQTVKTWTIQVSGNSSTKVTIPWSQPEQYSTVSAFSPTSDIYSNGNIALYLVNAVTTNGSTDPIYINVYYSSSNIQFGHQNALVSDNYNIVLSSKVVTQMAPVNSVPAQSCNEVSSSFFSRFFGEAHPTSVKELVNRTEFCYQTQDSITRTAPNAITWILPADGLVNQAQFLGTADKNGLNNTNFSFVSWAYHGRRGSITYTWYPTLDQFASRQYFTGQFIYRVSQAVYGEISAGAVGSTGNNIEGDAFATIGNEQYAATISVPYYNAFYTPNYPCSTLGEGVAFIADINLAQGSVGVKGSIFQSAGDDFNWVFFRGIPVCG
jgi:hypothetical protein